MPTATHVNTRSPRFKTPGGGSRFANQLPGFVSRGGVSPAAITGVAQIAAIRIANRLLIPLSLDATL
jgi:hypothetical protein